MIVFKSGTPGADKYKVKGNIHWVCAKSAYRAEVRLYDRLFRVPHPGAGERNFVDDLNAESKKVISAYLEPALKDAAPEERFQFERHGYFVADREQSETRCTGVQPRGHAARFVGQTGLRARVANGHVSSPAHAQGMPQRLRGDFRRRYFCVIVIGRGVEA